MNTKAFTLLELVMALVLGMLVMLGSVGVLENMQKQSAGFQSRITADMNWVEANRHLAQMVRPSSYLELSDSVGGTPEQFSTLTLRDYDGNVRGRYTNTPAALTYIDDTTGVGNRTGNNPLLNVNATFSAVPATTANPAKGTKYDRLVEVAVNYTLPFANTLRLRCATAVEKDEVWAVLFPRDDIQGQDFSGYSARQTWLGEYAFTAGTPNIYMVNLNRYGDRAWARNLNEQAFSYSAPVVPLTYGYMVAVSTADGGIKLMGTDFYGTLSGRGAWTRDLNVSGRTLRPNNILGNPSDVEYVISGTTTLVNPTVSTYFYVAKLFLGNLAWQWSHNVASPDGSSTSITSSLSAGGYIVAGAIIDSGGVVYPHIVKISDDGAFEWSKTFTGFIKHQQVESYANCRVMSICESPQGYTMLISGSLLAPLSRFHLVHLNSDGTDAGTFIDWSRPYANPSNPTSGLCYASSFRYIPETGPQNGREGYIIAGTIYPLSSSGQALPSAICLIRTNDTGNPSPGWTRTFSPGCDAIATSVWQNIDGSFIISGSAETASGQHKAYIIKTDIWGECPEASNPRRISL